MSTPSVHLAVLVVATDPAKADLATAMIIRGRATSAGHQIVQQHVTKDMEAGIRAQLARWIDDKDIDVILVTGAVESDAVASAVKPLITQQLDGFKDLFRYLAFQEMGAGAMLSNAEAAQCNTTFLFVMPGPAGAVGTAMDKLILPQLDPKTQPKNLVSQIPRLKEEAVPAAISPEKTTGGLGVPPKLPASPVAPRGKAPTGKNVIRRAHEDPPTKQIELAKLERLSNPNEAQTKPAIDLRKLLPKVPPGADENLDPDTDLELLAAPPPPIASEKNRIDTSPPIPPPRPLPSVLPSIKGNAFQSKEGTQPGAPAPTKDSGATKVTTQQRSAMNSIERNAFSTKDGTQPGTPVPTRSKPLTGPRPRPISVPPTNVFSDKPATSPSASAVTPAMGTRTGSEPQRPISSASINLPSSSIFAAAAEEAKEIKKAKELREQREAREAKAAADRAAERAAAADRAAAAERAAAEQAAERAATAERAAAERAAAADKPHTNGTPASHSPTPSVEMAPLVDAALVEEEAAPEPVSRPTRAPTAPPPPPVPARKREPTPGPVKTIENEPAVARKREPTPPPVRTVEATAPSRPSGELPVGMFNYPTKKRRNNRAFTILLLLFALGAGFGAVVYFGPKLMAKKDDGAKVAKNDPPTPPVVSPPPPTQEPTPVEPSHDPEPAIDVPADAALPPPNPPHPATTKPNTTKPNTTKPDTTKPNTTKPDTTKPDTANPDTTKPDTTKPDEPVDTKPMPTGDPDCDETSCVLSKYDRPCCERYKPKESDIKPRAGNVPEELDRSMVRAGIEKVKPAVVKCGEKAGVKGTVKIDVAVAPEGNVTSAEASESPDPGLGTCVATAIKKAQFGKSLNGGSFTYPFVF